MKALKLIALAILIAGCQPKKKHGWACEDTIKGNTTEITIDAQNFTGVNAFDTGPNLRHNCIYAARWPLENLQYNVAYSIHFTNLKAGDVINYAADIWAGNGSQGDVLFAWYTTLSTAGPEDPAFIPDYHTLSRHDGRGFNITPDAHYGTATDTGIFTITQDTPDIYLNFVVYGGYSNQVGNDAEYLQLGGDGGLTGFIIRN